MKKFFVLALFYAIVSVSPAFAKQATLLVAFGTSMEEAKPALVDIQNAFDKADFPKPILMAFTSDIIRKKLAEKGTSVYSVYSALQAFAKNGVTDVVIQPLHVLPAEEYMQFERMVIKFLTKNPHTFKSVKTGYPMLVSKEDLNTVVDIMLANIPSDYSPDDAIVFMAHGNDRGPGDIELLALNQAFQSRNPRAFVAAVEGAVVFDEVFERIKELRVNRVWLQPFMIVAGDHARNDLAGNEADSWASQFRAAGIEPMVILKGMGQLPEIQSLFVNHAKNAVVDLANTNKAD